MERRVDDVVIRMTRLAEEFAKAKVRVPGPRGEETLDPRERVVDAALRELRGEGFEHSRDAVERLMMHCFEVDGVDFCVVPRDGALVIDTVSWEEGETLDKGPLAGKILMMPQPDSEGRDDE